MNNAIEVMLAGAITLMTAGVATIHSDPILGAGLFVVGVVTIFLRGHMKTQ